MKACLRLCVVFLCFVTMLSFPNGASAHEDQAVRALDDALNHTVAESMPAIYAIEVSGMSFDTKTGVKKSENIVFAKGTAFGVTSDGLVLTKMHIVNPFFERLSSKIIGKDTFAYEDGDSIKISIALLKKDGTRYQATIEGGDPNDTIDLALLKIVAGANSGYPYLAISDGLPGYDDVISIGSPRGFPFSVGKGMVSNPDVIMEGKSAGGRHYVQTTALILPGSSGGPLIRVRDHRVVGIIDFINSPLPDLGVGVGLGFATPAPALKEFIEKELRRRASTK